jgi:hypothetical protein
MNANNVQVSPDTRESKMEFFSPKFATIDTWVLLSGMSRRNTYRYLGHGDLKAFKVGKRTLIDVEFGLAWIRSQPVAEISCEPPARATAAAELTVA